MFNYEEVDKYPTIEVVGILIPWIIKNQPGMSGYMISNIQREKGTDNYTVWFTVAQNGMSFKYKVIGDTVEKLENGSFWMS